MKRRLGLVAAATVLLCGCLIARVPPAAPSRNSELGLSISSFTLPNQLRVVLVTNPHAADVHVTMRYKVGGVDDPADQQGIAHLAEHLMFELSTDGETLFERLTLLATYFNGATTLDATAFISHASPSRLDDLLAIEAARLTTPCASIDAAAFERERDVVINELRERADSTNVQTQLADAVFPADHAYHHHTGGTVESVSSIRREQACAFVDAHYATGNAVLVVSGNLTREQLDAALAKRLARVEPRTFAPARVVAPLDFAGKRVEQVADVDHDTVLVAWALPADPKQRARLTALAATVADLTAGEADASVSMIELGDSRFPVLGIVLSAPGVDAYAYLLSKVNSVIVDLPQDLAHQSIAELDNLTFSATQHGALFRRYSALEPSAGRDMELASYLADGHVPAEIVQQQLTALRTFTRDEAIELARTRLNWDHASVVVLRASEGKPANAARPIIEQAAEPRERHRSDVAVDAARRPAVLDALPRVAGMRTRHLRNGLDVVLIPSPAVPTLDIRLVFRSGTGDEPPNKRGVATLAAHALEWNLTYVKDRLLFERAGGLESVDVETDRTTFSVSGMDNQLDYLLVGLRRRVREGLYDLGIVSFLKRVNRARQRRDEWLAPTDAWRASLYGQDHPYVRAGLLRAADDGVTRSDADAFRAAHYRPDNATLIVSGHFDPAVVDRWVDYLFADWRGHATARSAPRASLRPDSLASEGRSSQVSLSIAFPVTSTDRAAELVTVEMLSQMAGDVRLDLGASYGTSARLAEQRLSTLYILSGSIDASRAAIAIKLLADDIARLRDDPELAARVFVRARGRVLARLASLADSAPAAADQIEHDVGVGRAPLSDLGLAAAVRDLTIERISPSLVDIDLSRAAVWMHGPPDVVGRGFEILGRKPTRMAFDPATRTVEQDDGSSDDIVLQPYVDNVPRQLADPLTTRSTPFHFIYALTLGASFATIEHVTAAKRMSDSYTGAAATVEVGYRRHGPIRFGIRGDAAALAGSADTLAMFDVAPFVQSPLAAPFWLGAFAGVHGEHDMSSRIGAVFGGELGLDLIPVKHHWLGLFGQYAFIMNGDSHHGALTFGLAYRH